ncbi:MAG: cobalamin-dependent protein [Anaerolineae bacterium]|nr:cobalamin-dependent protein [Anaerolineae bacterium]
MQTPQAPYDVKVVMIATIAFANVPDEPLLNIKAVALATGIEAVTLRAWERRYGVPNPNRTDQGYRLYSERDVAILTWLKNRVDSGVTIKHAVAMLYSQLPQQAEPARSRPDRRGDSPASEQPLGISTESLRDHVPALMGAARSYDSASARRIIKQALAVHPIEDVATRLLGPTLETAGAEWRAGMLTLQHEHFITQIIREQLLAYSASIPAPWRDGRIVIGCAPDELHEMGVLMLSIFVQRRGWDVIYLGQSVGYERLYDSLMMIQPDVLMLSASQLSSLTELLKTAEILQMRANVGVHLVYGGPLFTFAPQLIGRIPGTFAGYSLAAALDRLDGLLSRTDLPDSPPLPPLSESVTHLARRSDAEKYSLIGILSALIETHDHAPREHSIAFPLSAASLAQHVVSGLIAALYFDAPDLLLTPAYTMGGTLRGSGISLDMLSVALASLMSSDDLEALRPFLSSL